MQYKYSAKIYFGEKVIMHAAGDDVASLYIWMLTQADGKEGSIHGEIIDIETKETVQKFRKAEEE